MSTPSPARRSSLLAGLLVTLVVLGIADRLLAPFYDPAGSVGHDHSYYLPRLLDGYYFFRENGPWAVPWWTPSFCGGLPALPDPQGTYYSVPQWLVIAGLPPLLAVRWALLLAMAAGGWGTWLLLRRVFGVSPPLAALLALLFACNGFVLHHAIIGHLVWLPALSFPLVAWALLAPPTARLRPAFLVALGGALLAAAFYAGMAQGLQPFVLALAALGLARGVADPDALRRFLGRSVAAGGLALALGAAKLVPALHYLSHFPRDHYLAPGFGSLGDMLLTWLRVLFFQNGVSLEAPHRLIVNASFATEGHELEFFLTPVVLVLLLLGLARLPRALRRARLTPARWLALAGAGLALLFPLALNLHTPLTARLIKATPVLASNANLLRWWLVYVLVLPPLAGWAGARLVPDSRRGWATSLLIAALALGWITAQDRSYYRQQPYRPGAIHHAYLAARDGDVLPPIAHIAVEVDEAGFETYTLRRNDALVAGGSGLLCYEAMFGYRLEDFPRGTLDPGPATTLRADGFNLKNPACYVFPEANGCEPGDPFRPDQREQVERLLHRRPIAVAEPLAHGVAKGLTALALLFLPVGLATPVLGRRRRTVEGNGA